MNEEQFTIHDEKELFEELSKDKCKRSDILINLNVALQKYQNIVANIKGIREIQEYKIAVVTIENELQKVQEKNQQLKEELKQKEDIINKAREKIRLLGKFDGNTCTRGLKMWSADFNKLLEILDIDKGE